jgi:hypothetical protein
MSASTESALSCSALVREREADSESFSARGLTERARLSQHIPKFPSKQAAKPLIGTTIADNGCVRDGFGFAFIDNGE